MLIRQDNITIRNATAADAPQLGVWWRDGSVMAHAGFPNGLSITDADIADDLATDSDDTCRRLIIEIDSMPVGEMNYRNKGNRTAEIGIKICDSNMQEKGYGAKILCMLIDELFSSNGYEQIVLDTNLNNERAQHVYEKIGFRRAGVRYDSWKNQLGEPQSAVDYKLEKADFYRRQDATNHRFVYDVKQISKLSPDDLPIYAEVIRRSFATVAQEFNLTKQNCPGHNSFITDERLAELVNDDYYPYGFFFNGKLIGFTSLTDTGGGIYEMGKACILPEYRHFGYGRMLLDFCKAKVSELGGKSITISIIDENTVLKKWYAANGFTSKGSKRLEGWPFTIGYMEWAVGG